MYSKYFYKNYIKFRSLNQLKCIVTFVGGNLTYEIPDGVADDHFIIDPLRGIVTTRAEFDRENKDIYIVPVYVTESSTPSPTYHNSLTQRQNSQFDVSTLVVKITDVNDFAPEFRPGTCYPLAVPENNGLAIIHTVVATDLDEGPNGDIVYSITGTFYWSVSRLKNNN